jgi:hypothetical protein
MNEAASYICGDKGSAVPEKGVITSVADNAVRDVERARTSKDCVANVARLRPDFRMQVGDKQSHIGPHSDIEVNNRLDNIPAQEYDTKASQTYLKFPN